MWRLATTLLASLPREQFLWTLSQGSFRQFWYSCLAIIGFNPGDYSPYGIRRGGATWFFLETASMDATLHRGRWSSNRTAKQYVDEGTLAMAKFFWTQPQKTAVRHLALKGAAYHKRLRQVKSSGPMGGVVFRSFDPFSRVLFLFRSLTPYRGLWFLPVAV